MSEPMDLGDFRRLTAHLSDGAFLAIEGQGLVESLEQTGQEITFVTLSTMGRKTPKPDVEADSEAWQFTDDPAPGWILKAMEARAIWKEGDALRVHNSRGLDLAKPGDWIVRHPFGDLYVRRT